MTELTGVWILVISLMSQLGEGGLLVLCDSATTSE